MTHDQMEIQKNLQIRWQILSLDVRRLDELEKSGTASAVQIQVRGKHQLRLESIERALQRLEKGVFGLCQTCGEQIDNERLKALPYAEQCIDCQRKLERKTIRPYEHSYTAY